MQHRYLSIGAMVAALCIVCAPRLAPASCIAISTEPALVYCRAVIAPPFTLGTLHVLAVLFVDQAADGCTGAEFRIDGFPAGWFKTATPNPASTAIGDPFGSACSIAFPACQGAPNQSVLLYTLTYLPTDMLVHSMNVVAAAPPYDPQFNCPVMRLCNGQRYCVSGGYFRFNDLGPCEVAVEPVSWSGVKALYRDAIQ